MISCQTLSELHEYFDPNQLSKDLGGLIDFRLFEWIEQQAVISESLKKTNTYFFCSLGNRKINSINTEIR